MEQLPKEKKQHIYYILDTDSADYDKMKQYGKHVIPFMSFRHILYSLVANLYIELPPIEEQRKIGGLLKAIDDKIELNNAINNNLVA